MKAVSARQFIAFPQPYLSIAKLRILQYLTFNGESPAWVFDEDELDELFKMRPRLIRLVADHINPVLDITREGEAAYRMGKNRLV